MARNKMLLKQNKSMLKVGLRSPAVSRMLRAQECGPSASAHAGLLSFPTDITIRRKQDTVTSGNPIQQGSVGY
jgi:hypothetical protein